MGDNKLIYVINKKLPTKLNLLYNITLVQPEKNDENDNKNPLVNLFSNLDEITPILKLNDSNYIKLLYFNRVKIHKFLYDNDEIITIKNENEENFIFYIYLSLLIEDNTSVVNYTYSTSLIDKLNIQQTKLKNEKIKKIILAKIIVDLITNYENDEKNEEFDFKRIKDFNEKIIKENINEFKIFDLKENNIFNKNIEEIYSDIIKYFIENQKLDDSDDYTEKIFKEIDLKSLNLTKNMFDNLSKILDKEKKYLKQFIIEEYDDLFKSHIINFYYTLFSYIIKNNFYIYQIPFLLQTRYKIKAILKSNMNLNKFYNSIKMKKDEKSKIETYLGAFIEYKYYYQKSLKAFKENEYYSSIASNSSIMNSLNNNRNNNGNYGLYGVGNISNSQSSGYFSGSTYKREREKSGKSLDQFDMEEEQKTEYEILKEICNKEITFVILCKSSFTFEFNKDNNDNIIYKCSEIKIDNNNQNINFEKIKQFIPENEILKDNYKKFLNFLEQILERIKAECSKNISFKITLTFSSNEVKNSIFNIECKYNLDINNEHIPQFKDVNILKKGLGEGYNYIINEIKGE